MVNTNFSKKTAIQIAEDLRGIDNQDNVIKNVETVCDYVIDILHSVVGAHMLTKHEKQTLDFWKSVKKQAKNIYK